MGRRLSTLATVAVVAFCAGAFVSFFTLPLWAAFVINIAKEGNRTDWLGFSGAVFAAFMTLAAAVIAWFAVRQQMTTAEEARLRSQEEAKEIGCVALSQPIHVASALLYAVQIASAANTPEAIREWDGIVDRACVQVSAMLDHFAIRDGASGMSVGDRLHYLIIVLQLSTMMSIRRTPLGILARLGALKTLESQLRGLQAYIPGFDPDLWRVFERDSGLPMP